MKSLPGRLCQVLALLTGGWLAAQEAAPPAPAPAAPAPAVTAPTAPTPTDGQPPPTVTPPAVAAPVAGTAAEPAAAATAPEAPAAAGAPPAVAPTPAAAAEATAPGTAPAGPPPAPSELRLNVQGTTLDSVLDYLSRAGGFIVVRDTPVQGTIDITSHAPVSPDDAIALLHTVLNQRGLALIREDRVLRIVKRDEARTRDLPIHSGSDPETVPKSSEMVTQVVPIRHTTASKLVDTLKPLMPSQTVLAANDDSNAVVITDTQTNVRRLLEIVKALDTTVSSILDIKVMPLSYADAAETADVITKVYETPSSRSGSQSSRGGGGGPGGGPGDFFARMRGMGEGGGDSSDASRQAKQTASFVRAVADQRGNAVVVTAPAEILLQIEELVKQIDLPSEAMTTLRVFPLRYANATDTANVIASLYPDTTGSTSRSRFGRGGFGFPGMPGMPFQQQGTSSASSERKVTQGRVIAVADTRTNSVIVSASADAQEDIAKMLEELDATPVNVPTVHIYQLENGDVTTVKEVLDGMFDDLGSSGSGTSSTRRSSSSNRTGSNNRNSTGTGQSSTRNSSSNQRSSSGFGQ